MIFRNIQNRSNAGMKGLRRFELERRYICNQYILWFAQNCRRRQRLADVARYISQFSRCTPDLSQKGYRSRFSIRSGQCIQCTICQL